MGTKLKSLILVTASSLILISCNDYDVTDNEEVESVSRNNIKTQSEYKVIPSAHNLFDEETASLFTFASDLSFKELENDSISNSTNNEYLYYIKTNKDPLDVEISIDNLDEEETDALIFIFQDNSLISSRVKDTENWSKIHHVESSAYSNTTIEMQVDWVDQEESELSYFVLNLDDERSDYYSPGSRVGRHIILNEKYNIPANIEGRPSIAEVEESDGTVEEMNINYINHEGNEIEIAYADEINEVVAKEQVTSLLITGTFIDMNLHAVWFDTEGNHKVLEESSLNRPYENHEITLPDSIDKVSHDNEEYRQFVIVKNHMGEEVLDDAATSIYNDVDYLSSSVFIMEIPPSG